MSSGIHIGCSGWHYKHWLGTFYPKDLPASEMLARYSKTFDTVEINNTFYALPHEKSVQRWREIPPDHFCFAVKASRYITHVKKLNDPVPALEKFFPVVEQLREKLGPILFQFPPHWKVNLARLKEFLPLLPKEHKYAFEFRHPSWYVADVYETLKDFGIAFCMYDRDLVETPLEITAQHIYVRLHGSGPAFGGNYQSEHLVPWAKRIEEWTDQGHEVWFYFNNDWHGYAINNALELERLLQTARVPTR
jgi:uncharacterized protein YecE (DUF72 family)